MIQIETLAWEKSKGLVPAVVQDAGTGQVLMLGYMNREALGKTLDTGRVTFWSRSRGCLWTKGDTSGNWLALSGIRTDCDADALLISAVPSGPTCHRGTDTCFDEQATVAPALAFLGRLDRLIAQRERQRPAGSYTTRLFEAGVTRIAQKVGEEGVETALAAAVGEKQDTLNESADLLYHLLVLLRASGAGLEDVVSTLQARHGS